MNQIRQLPVADWTGVIALNILIDNVQALQLFHAPQAVLLPQHFLRVMAAPDRPPAAQASLADQTAANFLTEQLVIDRLHDADNFRVVWDEAEKMIFLSASSLEKSAISNIATKVSIGVPSQKPSWRMLLFATTRSP